MNTKKEYISEFLMGLLIGLLIFFTKWSAHIIKNNCKYYKSSDLVDCFECIENCDKYPQNKIKDFTICKWIIKLIDLKSRKLWKAYL